MFYYFICSYGSFGEPKASNSLQLYIRFAFYCLFCLNVNVVNKLSIAVQCFPRIISYYRLTRSAELILRNPRDRLFYVNRVSAYLVPFSR